MDGPALLVTSPSRPLDASHLRRGSLGDAVDAGRPRRDTGTTNASSELSSENEFDSALFQRKPVSRKTRGSQLLAERIQEDEREDASLDEAEESDTTLSSALVGSVDSGFMLENLGSSLAAKLPGLPRPSTPRSSPRKPRNPMPLQVGGPRPISMAIPVSLLSEALRSNTKQTEIPFTGYAALSGKDDPSRLHIKIYAPFSSSTPFEMLLRRESKRPVTVADAIGFALWRYNEEKLEPRMADEKANVNWWNFRMVEDGEVEYDFPALGRTRAITDFTSNNNRPVRGRSREKPWDEFALVEATEKEFKENEAATPNAKEAPEPPLPSIAQTVATPSPTPTPYGNLITGPIFSTSAMRKDGIPFDAPTPNAFRAIPRTGLRKTLSIRFTDENLLTRTTKIEVTTDTYMAEVFDQACKRLNVDKAMYVLKVANTNTIVPQDRTVEALGERAELDLQRRRFVGDGSFGLSGSPGSSSPNAPLLIAGGTPKRGRPFKSGLALSSAISGPPAPGTSYRRYNVVRKQPMSFSSSSSRIIMLDGEFMHIMPSEGPKAMWEMGQGKSTTVPFSSVVGCKVSRKHARMFRVVVFKERESKRYDFEATTSEEAVEIVEEIRKGVENNNPEKLADFGS
jgi:hypothetical protein